MNIVELIIFLLPAYLANSIPVVLGGGMPLDFRKTMDDGERILGDGKTIRGFVAGVAAGTFIAGVITLLWPLSFFASAQMQFLGGTATAFGAMAGDAFGSFAKRRIKFKPGQPFFPDTFLFIVFALIFVFPFISTKFYDIYNIAFCIGLTLIMHPLFNIIANKAGLKRVPW
jgi:CDP-2,3-bis-(O-geranylgeranyl)-sn-glycerol synthase